jgi:LysM repeat protein
MFSKHKEKEGPVRTALSSRRLLILLALLLTFALVACERPLNEEEATATPETSDVPEETQPEAATPAPGSEESSPTTPEQPAAEGGETPAEGTPTESAPGETTPEQPAPTPEGGTEGSETPAEQPTTSPPTDQPAEPVQPGVEQTHVVQAGENLYRIGLSYGCSVLELSTYNGIANPNWINVGQVIRIPATCGA